MQRDSDTDLLPAAKELTVTVKCRRCDKQFESGAMRVGDALWPFSCYCPTCYAPALAEFQEKEREQVRTKRARLWSEDVGRDAFTDTDETKLDPAKVSRVTGWKVGPKGMLLHGESGKTKSRLMFLLARRLFVEEEVSLIIVRATAASRRVTELSTVGNTVESYVRSLINVPVLFIDDLGKEAQSDRWESALVEILDARGAAGRPVIVTTNYTGDKLISRYRDASTGEAIVRRLREFCAGVSFT